MSMFLSIIGQRVLSLLAWAAYLIYHFRYDFFPWLFGKAWFLLIPVGVVWYAERIAAELPLPAFVMRRNPILAQQKLARLLRILGWILLLLPWLGPVRVGG